MDKWQSTPVAHSNALSKAAGSHGRSDRRRPDPRVGSGREPPAGAGCDADGEHPAGTRLCRAGSGRRRPSGQADHRRSTGQRHILGAFVRSCAHTSRRLPSACPDLLRTPRGRGPAANRPVICPPLTAHMLRRGASPLHGRRSDRPQAPEHRARLGGRGRRKQPGSAFAYTALIRLPFLHRTVTGSRRTDGPFPRRSLARPQEGLASKLSHCRQQSHLTGRVRQVRFEEWVCFTQTSGH